MSKAKTIHFEKSISLYVPSKINYLSASLSTTSLLLFKNSAGKLLAKKKKGANCALVTGCKSDPLPDLTSDPLINSHLLSYGIQFYFFHFIFLM
jgi:hypothetical protein